MIYAVCTNCAFLRVFSENAEGISPPSACPACDGELIVRKRPGRFPPTYVSRVSLELLAQPQLEDGALAEHD